jgi:chromosome segregation ATPase
VLQDCSLALSNLRAANGKDNARPAVKPSVQRLYEVECSLRASVEKKLADAQKKIEQLTEMREKGNLVLAKTQVDYKYLVDSSKSDKAEQKKKLDGQKASSKKDLDNHKATAASLLTNKKDALKDANSQKASLKKKFDKGEKELTALKKLQEATQSKLHAANASESSLMRTRTELQNEVKTLKKEVLRLEKKSDDQLVKKQAHELDIQKMKNEYKQLELDHTRERFEIKTKAPISKSSASMSLEGRMELESHKVECKRRTKDDDAARDKMKRDMKSKDIQSNFGFVTNMMQNQSNVTGGMWQQGSQGVQDVSG